MQALENAKANDLLFWASRYNLFVLWSADRTHPWDSLPGAASYVTLEIGKQRGSDSEVPSPTSILPFTMRCSINYARPEATPMLQARNGCPHACMYLKEMDHDTSDAAVAEPTNCTCRLWCC